MLVRNVHVWDFNGFDDRLMVSTKQLVDQKYTPRTAAVALFKSEFEYFCSSSMHIVAYLFKRLPEGQ